MSKFLDKLKTKNEMTIEKERKRLQKVKKDAEDMYQDSGYDRYFKKISKAEKELDELVEFSGFNVEPVLVINHEDEYLKLLRQIKAKWSYLKFDIPVTADSNTIDELLMDVH